MMELRWLSPKHPYYYDKITTPKGETYLTLGIPFHPQVIRLSVDSKLELAHPQLDWGNVVYQHLTPDIYLVNTSQLKFWKAEARFDLLDAGNVPVLTLSYDNLFWFLGDIERRVPSVAAARLAGDAQRYLDEVFKLTGYDFTLDASQQQLVIGLKETFQDRYGDLRDWLPLIEQLADEAQAPIGANPSRRWATIWHQPIYQNQSECFDTLPFERAIYEALRQGRPLEACFATPVKTWEPIKALSLQEKGLAWSAYQKEKRATQVLKASKL